MIFRIAALWLLLCGPVLAGGTMPGPRTLSQLLTENSFITSGSWGLFLGPFNKGVYVSPTYSQSANYPTAGASWPNSVAMQWTWPSPASATVNATIANGSNQITINSVTSGSFIVGYSIFGLTGISGARLINQVSGTPNGAGVYTMNVTATQGNTGAASMTPCSGVCGFYQVSYGNYYFTVPQTPITPRQIGSITTLSCAHSWTYTGNLTGYDVIYDFFGTAAPNDNTPLWEVEIFLHTPSYAQSYINGSTQIGTTTFSGITWQVAKDTTAHLGTDFLFAPTNYADVAVATIDIKAALSYLVSQAQISNTAYYNGHSIGIEPHDGSGGAVLNSYSCTYN